MSVYTTDLKRTICWVIVQGTQYLKPDRAWTPDWQDAALFSLEAARRHMKSIPHSRALNIRSRLLSLS